MGIYTSRKNYWATCISLGNNVTAQHSRQYIGIPLKSHIIWGYLIYFTESNFVGFSLQVSAVRALFIEGVGSFHSY